MAQRYAKLAENNIVIGEILLDDSACGSSEAEAVANLQKMYGWQFWKRTYYGTEEGETNPRKNYASLGYVYDESADAFKPVSPDYPSWTRNPETLLFEAPTPMPETYVEDPDNPGEANRQKELYNWDEETTSWVKR